jgi:hypothetical protein
MRKCEQESAPSFSVPLCRFSCNWYLHIIIFILIMTVVNQITLHSGGVSPLEAHSRGYDDDDDDDDDEHDTKQFPRTKTERYVLKLCGNIDISLQEENSNLLSFLQYFLYCLLFSVSVTFAKSFE